MTVRRIVANIAVTDTGPSTAFYRDILGLQPVMDHGWIVTLAADAPSPARPQIGIATQGGSGTPVPDLSIEVDDLDAVIARTPTRRLATMADVAGTALFLLDNSSINGVNLNVDNGWLLT